MPVHVSRNPNKGEAFPIVTRAICFPVGDPAQQVRKTARESFVFDSIACGQARNRASLATAVWIEMEKTSRAEALQTSCVKKLGRSVTTESSFLRVV
jgi:hypothetical protein